jgi:membrane protease YdiL (CAAX protease family)
MRLTAGLLAVYALFHQLAATLGSNRGQAGIRVGTAVVLATIAVQVVLFGQDPRAAIRWLGLGRPTSSGLIAALAIGLLLGLVVPAFALVRGVSVEPYLGWLWLLPGLFAQAGVAEEILFRGYLFRHVREGRPFWRAVLLGLGPFAAVHLVLFRTMPWPIALAAVALAVAATPPLAYLFELGGNTIWGPAILHFVIQGAVKVIQLPGEESPLFPIIWMVACASLPFLVFLVRRPVLPQPTAPCAA